MGERERAPMRGFFIWAGAHFKFGLALKFVHFVLVGLRLLADINVGSDSIEA
jgi:hypothetical protein